jgi:hypothetical protein
VSFIGISFCGQAAGYNSNQANPRVAYKFENILLNYSRLRVLLPGRKRFLLRD